MKMKPTRTRGLAVATRNAFGLAFILSSASPFLTGCSSKSGSAVDPPLGTTVDAAITPTEAGTAGDGGQLRYPAGPFGVGKGQAVEDATFFGYPRYDNPSLARIALHDF